MSALGWSGPSLIILIAALTGGPARAQDLDASKSAAQLFTATCAECHRSPRGLAKGRFSWTLSSFLQEHYTSSAASAQILAGYLQSVDAPRTGAQAARLPAASASTPALRPPASIPAR